MRFGVVLFPGIPTGEPAHSQRSYSYDPAGSLSQQQTHYPELTVPTAQPNLFSKFRVQAPGRDENGVIPQRSDPEIFGNVEDVKVAFFGEPGWWGGAPGPGGINNNWDDLRLQGVDVSVYAPHMEMYPVPAHKLYQPGSGFVLPATFLGQPLVSRTSPPGT